MKKITLGLLALAISATVNAKHNFEGWFVGGELHSTKHSFSVPYSETGSSRQGELTASSSNSLGIGVLGGYGFSFAGDFVGQAEAKLRTGRSKSKLFGETITEEKFALRLSYLQGYRITPEIMPYIKLGVSASAFESNQEAICASRCAVENYGARGMSYGFGMKYALTPNLELGAEYSQANLKAENHIKFKTQTIGLNGTYRF